jgi:germacradienol/geosmin synthase
MQFLRSWIWEVDNYIERRVTDPVDYIEMRRTTVAGPFVAFAVLYGTRAEPPRGLLDSRPMRALLDACYDAFGLSNDIFSYRVETERDGEINNAVTVVQRLLGCDLQDAVTIVRDLADAQVREFERIVDIDIAPLVGHLGLDPHERDGLSAYVRGLQDCLAGYYHWHDVTTRYELRPRLAAAAGPGRSAAALAERLARIPMGRVGLEPTSDGL